jgi:hypothetical protein
MRRGELEHVVKDMLEDETFVVQREELESVVVEGKKTTTTMGSSECLGRDLNLC